MYIFKSISGLLHVELTSAEPEAALAAVNGKGIELCRLQQISDLTCRFMIRRADYKALAALTNKRGENLKILKRIGIYWAIKGLAGRPVLLLGMAAILALSLYLPSRILFVRVEGNTTVPTRQILYAAEESGICFGSSRRTIRSEKVKNGLLASIPQLEWAGVNTSGCVATISVRERAYQSNPPEETGVSSIVADRDGLILSVTVTRGTGLCKVGQGVKTGQTLISGYTDCGIIIQAAPAEGEVYAQTNRELNAVTLSEYEKPGEVTSEGKKISLILGKKRINLWKDSGILTGSCGRMYEEYYVTLPGGFQLPIALCIETYVTRETVPGILDGAAAKEQLEDFAERCLREQMIAGEVLSREESVTKEQGVYALTGEYVCTEMIGRVQREKIGDINGKNS